jgi:POT family proton-dependent oligopeptide transporter
MSSQTATAGRRQHTFLGHPVGLYVLFFTEMWERFSYYGMRALLMLYMVNYFRWSQEHSSSIYKWYTSLVYLTPLVGGYLADRVLGNKWAVIIGATLMAIGHFLMAFEPVYIFFSALVFLIAGNGFFKPNMSTQVGRLYPQNDPRRDGAYTIFYMGINLGAFLSPLLCGWLAVNTVWKYHAGFAAAGVGMVLGLVTYLIGLPLVRELAQDESDLPKERGAGTMRPPMADEEGIPPVVEDLRGNGEAPAAPPPHKALPEKEAERTPSVMPSLTRPLPVLLGLLGVALAVAAPVLALLHLIPWDTMIGMEIAAGSTLFATWISAQVHMALRDRVLAILLMGLPVVAFWAAGEQAGNALNVWADKVTDRYLTTKAPPPALFPGDEEQRGVLDPIPTTWFQAINPLAIFVLAPPFAALWTWLSRRGWNPSIPSKMALGVLLMSASMGIMTWSAKRENGPTTESYAGPIPDGVLLNDQNQLCRKEDGVLVPYHAGRLTYDPQARELHMQGVLSDIERDEIAGATAPPGYVEALEDLRKQTEEHDGNGSEKLAEVPPGLDLRYAGLGNKVTFDDDRRLLEAHNYVLKDRDIKLLRVAGADQAFRNALDALYLNSSHYRVSSWWLFWFYMLSTVGELCLSPIGLSMVSKLAPARFATMLMGLWMLTSFFGNFIAGMLGEHAETTPPITYFAVITLVLAALSVVVFLMARKIVALMHGVE